MNLFGDEDWNPSHDPDVAALVRADGSDPYKAVRRKVEDLLNQLDDYGTDTATPLERITFIASLVGFSVKPAAGQMSAKGRAAMFIPPQPGSKQGQIIYDSTLPMGRVIYSIGHEIAHSFFPNSHAGVQFRSTQAATSRRGRQLEMLCEYAASLLVMPDREFRAAVGRHGLGLDKVELIRAPFWTSFEATVYRMADSAGVAVAAVKFQYRLAKKDLDTRPSSGSLFPVPDPAVVHPKYRVQSTRRSPSFPTLIPYNKSVPESSCVYQAAAHKGIHRGMESITFSGRSPVTYRIEAMQAPFQPAAASSEHPDILALFTPVSK